MKYVWTAILLLAGCGKEDTVAAPPPVPVKVALPLRRDVPETRESVGQTRGSTEVEVRARVEGFIDAVRFQEGRVVRRGDVLYLIDPKPYLAAVNQAKGNLASAIADHARAKQDVARYKPLVEANAISREEYETSVALERAAAAKADAARASLESSELDLGYTTVTAPIDGLAGKTEVKTGALVGKGQTTLLTTISAHDPIHCRFSISERDYLTFARRVNQGGESPTDFEMILSDGSLFPHKGRFIFIERLVDPTTGTILVEVAFPNPEGLARPGLFARVRYPVALHKGAILVPLRALSELQATYSVGVVMPDNRVEIRPVKVGPRLRNLRVVESGLKPDERVIVDGLLKVKSGSIVAPIPVELDDAGAEEGPPEREAK
ncbi:MAG TPA: efflux RND transporter periplasmic adaptor subunit [Planctomycetota bacterium]